MVNKLSLISDWIRQQNRNRRVVLTVLAALVVFVTTYMLILPAITLDEDEAAQQGGIDVNVEEPAADESATGELVADEPATDVSDQAGAPGDAAAATTISDGGKTYGVSVTCGEAAEVPANAALEVTEITRKHEGYDALLAGAEQALGKGADIAFARFFDIRIVDENGDKVEIAAPVDVRIELTDKDGKKEYGEDTQVVHFPGDDEKGEVIEEVAVDGKAVNFAAPGFSVYAVIGGTEPTARMQVNFHAYDENGNEKVTTMYVKNEDSAEALEMILYDPGVGKLEDGELFRGWTLNEDYTAAQGSTSYNKTTNPNGAMTIDDVREWAKDKQGSIEETDQIQSYDFYPVILKHYTVTYLDRFGVSLDTDSAYMLRSETSANYTVNMAYETNDDDYHFKGWVSKDEDKITTSVTPDQVTVIDEGWDDNPYNLYKNNTAVSISGNVTLKAHAPKGKWLVFHEVKKGATYTAPQFLEEGEEPQMPNPDNMYLLGYQFAGWYLDEAYEQPFTPGPISEKTDIYAKWEPATWAPYTVIIWKQNLDGTYAYAESVQLAGAVGTTVATTGTAPINQNQTGNYVLSAVNNNDADYLVINGRNINHEAVSKSYRARHLGRSGTTHNYENPDYIGFNCAKIDQNVVINPEGNAVVNVYYDRITYTIKIYQARSSNGNYQVARTRSGNNDSNPLGPSATNYGMNWTGNILYHKDGDTWRSGYQYTGPASSVHTETSGGYTYYYTAITAKYGENIADQWPKYSYYPDLATGNTNTSNNTYGFVSWYMMSDAAGYQGAGSGLNTFKGIISKMDEKLLGDITSSNGNLLFGRYDERDLYYYTYQIWYETLEGEDYSQATTKIGTDGKTYYLANSFVANSAAADPTKATQAPTYAGFENVPSMNKQPAPVNHRSTCEFYYHRIANPIIYRDGAYFDGNGNYLNAYPALGEDVESDPIPYETNITSYNGGYNEAGVLVAGDNYKTDYPSSYDGFVFEGWYTDASCTTPYKFTTMLDESITVYAKFRQVQYRVFLQPNVPQGKVVYWGADTQQMNFRGTYGMTVSVPNGKLITDDEHPDQLDDSYEFAGWYLDPQFKRPFDQDAFVMNDDIASAYDKTTEMTDYMDKYGNIGSGPDGQAPYNSDLVGNNGGDRWWIDKKVVLYGKWIKKLDAGTGIQVKYDPNGGSNEVKDDLLYKDGTSAVVQSAPVTPPTTTVGEETVSKTFLYWVLQKWNPQANDGQGAFEDIEPLSFVYPGDSFTVSYENAQTVETTDPDTGVTTTEYFVQLRAEYTDPDKETPTHIWWYSNFGDNEVVKVNDTSIASGVEDILINEAVNIKPANTFTREGYTFLGWARVESTDAQGNPLPGHPKLHPDLGEDDLFLKYVEASGDTPAHFEAKNKQGDWVTVTQIAADEKYAYHDLYAVWQRYFPVTVIKHVVGADTSTQFEFTPNFDFNKDSSSDYHKKFELTGETGSNTKEFVNVPEGSKFTITEKAYDDFNTSVKYSVDADGTEKDITDQTIENGGEITVTGDVTVEFTNSLKAHPITILKVDENNTEQTLPGAEFLLSMKNDNDEYVAYVTEGHPDGSYTTNDRGKIGLELPAGKFQLIEQNAPDGYIITNSTVLFTVNQDGTITVTSGSNASASGATLTITNKSGTPLPNSGGPGTHWIYLLGAILMLGSGITLVSRRRIGKTE